MDKLLGLIHKKIVVPSHSRTLFAVAIVSIQKDENGHDAYRVKWEDAHQQHVETTWECEELVSKMPSLLQGTDNPFEAIRSDSAGMMARKERQLLFRYKEVMFVGEMSASEHEYQGCLRLLKPKMTELAEQCLRIDNFTSKQYRLCKEAGSSEFLKFRLTRVEYVCPLRQFFYVGDERETLKPTNREQPSKEMPQADYSIIQKKKEKKQGTTIDLEESDEVEVKEEEETPKLEASKPQGVTAAGTQAGVETMVDENQSGAEEKMCEQPAQPSSQEMLQILRHQLDMTGEILFTLRLKGVQNGEPFALYEQTICDLGYGKVVETYKRRHDLCSSQQE